MLRFALMLACLASGVRSSSRLEWRPGPAGDTRIFSESKRLPAAHAQPTSASEPRLVRLGSWSLALDDPGLGTGSGT